MSTYRETGTIEGPFPTEDPIKRLLGFYLANGYRVVERRGDATASAGDETGQTDGPLSGAKLERGRAGAGWWTSNMTELHTHVTLESNDTSIRIVYQVDTTGQLLKDDEKAFWPREIQWAKRYATDDSQEARDLRDEEARRAKHQTNDIRSFGIWAAVAVFLAILTLGFFGII